MVAGWRLKKRHYVRIIKLRTNNIVRETGTTATLERES